MANGCSGTVLLVAGASLLAIGLAQPALAQDSGQQATSTTVDPTATGGSDASNATTGGDIVVTATRQSETLSHVPVSIAAFSQKRMDEQGVRQIDDLARLAPGVTFERSTYGNGSSSNIAIRGISSTVGAATTGIYINDTPIQVRALGFTASNTYPQVFDLERVEVVRGPQGTLFGAGAEGGAVRFITPEPSLDKLSVYGRGEASITEHGAPSYEGGAAVGLPLVTDKLGLRASVWYRRDGGYVDRVDQATGVTVDKDANSQNALVGRAALTWAPVEGLKITPSIFYQRVHVDDSSAYWEAYSPRHKDYNNANIIAQPSTDRFILPALNMSYDTGDISLISVSSYFDRKSKALFDYTAFTNGAFAGTSIAFIPGYLATSQMNNRQKNFVQEVRVQSSNPDSRLKWVVGGFYSRSKQEGYQNTVDPYFSTLIPIISQFIVGVPLTVAQFTGTSVLPGNVTYLNINRGTDTQIAGFGQLDLKVTERLTATAGGRVSNTKFDYTAIQAGPGAGTAYRRSDGKQEQTPFTPKLGLSYQASDDALLYVSAAKGFRIGGVNAAINPVQCGGSLSAIGLSAAPDSYKSDSVWSYESGVKGKALGRTLQFEASAFYTRWKGIQQYVYLPACGQGFVTNYGKASSRGFDLAAQVRLSSRASFGMTLGWVDAHLDETIAPGVGGQLVQKGDKIPGSPWSVNLSFRNGFDAFGQALYARADYDYRSRAALRTAGQNPRDVSYDPGQTPADEQNNVSLRLGGTFGPADISLFVNNLLDQKPGLARSHYSPPDPYYTNLTVRPRTVGLTGTVRY